MLQQLKRKLILYKSALHVNLRKSERLIFVHIGADGIIVTSLLTKGVQHSLQNF